MSASRDKDLDALHESEEKYRKMFERANDARKCQRKFGYRGGVNDARNVGSTMANVHANAQVSI